MRSPYQTGNKGKVRLEFLRSFSVSVTVLASLPGQHQQHHHALHQPQLNSPFSCLKVSLFAQELFEVDLKGHFDKCVHCKSSHVCLAAECLWGTPRCTSAPSGPSACWPALGAQTAQAHQTSTHPGGETGQAMWQTLVCPGHTAQNLWP